jgi:CRP-like cAMP-binding protein
VRTQRSPCDGRRYVEAFHFPDELFGLQSSAIHKLAAEAVVETTVLTFRLSSIETLAAGDIAVAQQLWRHMAAKLERSIEYMLTLSRMAESPRGRLATSLCSNYTSNGTERLRFERMRDAGRASADWLTWTKSRDYVEWFPATVARPLEPFE